MSDRDTTPGKDRRSPEMLELEIKKLAKGGDFAGAQHLREVLLASHPLALAAIIASGEAIEAAMSLQIDKDHLAIWDKLYSTLSQEEQNCLFYATKGATVDTGKIMIRQGKPIQRLLFIDNGRVTLFHSKGDERILLGQLSRGDILGEETFSTSQSRRFLLAPRPRCGCVISTRRRPPPGRRSIQGSTRNSPISVPSTVAPVCC